MATTVSINAVDVEWMKKTIRVFDTLSHRSTASFYVYDSDGTANYLRSQEVEILVGGNSIFNGYIDTPKRKRVGPSSDVIIWSISCKDNHYLADKRIAAVSYEDKTSAFIVNDLITNYLAAEGVSAGTIDTGVTFDEVIINYQPISKALDALAKKNGFIWYIAKDKKLYFMERTTTAAPFSVSATDILRRGRMASELANEANQYRNRQYIRAGKDVTAEQTENFTGDGDTVAFALGYPLAKVPTITVDLAGQDMGIKGLDDATKDFYWSKGDPIVVARVAPANATDIVVTYTGLYEFIVQADNPAEQAAQAAIDGTSGIVEVIDEEPAINRKADALVVAIASLDQYGTVGKQFKFPVYVWGLEPGQIVTVDYPEYDINDAELLIESVQITEIAPGELKYTIKAIEGPETGDWTNFFGSLADTRGDIMERLTIGTDQLLILLSKTSEEWEWDESVAETVWACPICDPATICGPAIIVC